MKKRITISKELIAHQKLEKQKDREFAKYGMWPNPGSVKRYTNKLLQAVDALYHCAEDEETICGQEQAIYRGMIFTLQIIITAHRDRLHTVHMPQINAAMKFMKNKKSQLTLGTNGE